MNRDTAYALWLQAKLGFGSNKAKPIYEMFCSAREFYDLGYEGWSRIKILSKNELSRMKLPTRDYLAKVLDDCKDGGISIVSVWDDDYPSLLREIANPPVVLFYKGELPEEDELCITVVGARSCSDHGIEIAGNLSYNLAKRGACVVSGGALGIDSAAHKGAIKANGRTICVLGNGINASYLSSNKPLRDEICKTGAIISEYPPFEPARNYYFPLRNRIMSGISHGVVVVEAAGKSGSLVTANLALEQNRDVFAVPGDISNPLAEGVNNIIKIGAIPVTSVEDIFGQYENSFKYFSTRNSENEKSMSIVRPGEVNKKRKSLNSPKKKQKIHSKSDNVDNTAIENSAVEEKRSKVDIDKFDLSDNAKNMYRLLTECDLNIENVCEKMNISASEVNILATELEMEGLITTLAGKTYTIA